MSLSLTPLTSSAPNAAPNVLSAATGAVSAGVNYITYNGGAGAYTLAAPTADGQEVFIQTLTAQAHVVTTPANCVNGADDTLTFSNAAFNFIKMRGFGGQWLSNTAEKLNVALTEV